MIGYDRACMLFVIDDDPRVERLIFAKNYPFPNSLPSLLFPFFPFLFLIS